MLVVTTTVRLWGKGISTAFFHQTFELLTWSTGFMATPRVLGQELRLTANLCLARDASVDEISSCFPCKP